MDEGDKKEAPGSEIVPPAPAPTLSQNNSAPTAPTDVTSVALRGLFILALFYTFYLARSFLLPVAIALLLNFLFKPVIRFLAKLRVPEWLSAGLVLIGLIGTIVIGGLFLSEPASEMLARGPESVQNMERRLRELLKPASQFSKAANEVQKITEKQEEGEKTQKVEIKKPALVNTIMNYARGILFAAGEMLILLYFLLASGDLFIKKLLKILPGLSEKKEAVEIAREIEVSISRFLVITTLINIVEGVFIGLGCAMAGLPNPVLWGVLAALLNYIPYLGAWTGIALITLASFLKFESPTQAMIPPLIYLAVNLADNFVSPFVQGSRLRLNPVIVFVAIAFWGWLWGVVGVFLAVPILMTFKIFCDHIKSLSPVSEFLNK